MNDKKSFNHNHASLVDKLALVGEIEHLRRHLLRSAVSLRDTDEEVFYLAMAKRCQVLRRQYMQKHFSDVPEELWCAVKAACCIRQLSYEVWDGKDEMLGDIDALCDEIFTNSLGEDMQGCAVCREDKEKAEMIRVPGKPPKKVHWENLDGGDILLAEKNKNTGEEKHDSWEAMSSALNKVLKD